MRIFSVEYQVFTLLVVKIDEEKALPAIKQMVEFWSDFEEALLESDGDYVKAWIAQIGLFILRNSELPNGREGWVEKFEDHGIEIVTWDPYEFQTGDLDIEEEKA